MTIVELAGLPVAASVLFAARSVVGWRTWAAVLLIQVVVAVIAGLLGASCVRLPNVPSQPRTTGEQMRTAVVVESSCSMHALGTYRLGSGVLVDGRHVVTAYHVVACGIVPLVYVETSDGRRQRFVLVSEDLDNDTATLEIASAEILPVAPVRRARARPGDTACAATARPRRELNCGTVEQVAGRQLRLSNRTLLGNSGSGLYNARGALVGIVTAQAAATAAESDGSMTGYATAVRQ